MMSDDCPTGLGRDAWILLESKVQLYLYSIKKIRDSLGLKPPRAPKESSTAKLSKAEAVATQWPDLVRKR